MGEHFQQIHFPELTHKQFVILELYATGLPIKLIQHQLSISPDAVKGHLTAIKSKFGCACTSELRQVFISRLLLSIYKNINY